MSRGVVDRCDHLDEAVFHSDLDPQTPELSAGADLELLELIVVQISRVGVETCEHAADRPFQKGLVLDTLDVFLLDASEDLRKGSQVAQRERILGRGRRRLGFENIRVLDRLGERAIDTRARPDETNSENQGRGKG